MKPLVAITRNGRVESIHWGIICVVDKYGKMLFNIGNPYVKTYFRSSAKPLQVLPLILSGAGEAYGFTSAEIALACASHTGEPVHQRMGQQVLQRLGLTADVLHCGLMRPYDEHEDDLLKVTGIQPSVFHCSCSGKHIAMLAMAIHNGYSLADYEHPQNPLQQKILQIVAAMSDEDIANIELGTDGCGIPIYLLTIRSMALSYAKLVAYANANNNELANACHIVVEAMTSYPEIVSGRDEFCAAIMRTTNGRLLAKVGAEAIYCVGTREKEYGICVKISDGSERALFPAVLHTLFLLGLITESELSKLDKWYHTPILNNLGNKIGSIVPVFDLNGSTNVDLGMKVN